MRIQLTPAAIISRLFQLALAFIPACTGIFACLNNIEGAKATLASVISPLLTMKQVDPNFTWRAIDTPGMIKIAYVLITSCETLVGILAIIGILKMLRHFLDIHEVFITKQAWARAACVFGFLIWGLGFYTIAGDFFLAWQNPALNSLQGGGLNYVLMMAVPYFFLKMHELSSTV